MMDMVSAVVLGLIEGITEFLPISSTGYLILSQDLLNFWQDERGQLFVVVVQLGAILAVVVAYFRRLWQAFLGLLGMGGRSRALGLSLIVATLPVMVLGLSIADYITAVLFSPLVVAIMLIVGAVLILWVEKNPRPMSIENAEEIGFKTALKIGLCQCLALIPGLSRSGATIIGGLWLGLSRKAATEFSFFLGIPVIVGAALLDLIKHRDVLHGQDWQVLGIGVLSAFVVAWVCIRLLVAWVARRDFTIFAWLRIITGVAVLVAYYGFGYGALAN